VVNEPTITRSTQQIRASSPNKFRNPDLEAKTAALQAEFDALLAEKRVGSPVRVPDVRVSTEIDNVEGFYRIMDELKANDNFKRHVSPTRRLIA